MTILEMIGRLERAAGICDGLSAGMEQGPASMLGCAVESIDSVIRSLAEMLPDMGKEAEHG